MWSFDIATSNISGNIKFALKSVRMKYQVLHFKQNFKTSSAIFNSADLRLAYPTVGVQTAKIMHMWTCWSVHLLFLYSILCVFIELVIKFHDLCTVCCVLSQQIQQMSKSWYYCKCLKNSNTKVSDKMTYANSADPDQTAPSGAVWSGSTLFAIPVSILRNCCIKSKI